MPLPSARISQTPPFARRSRRKRHHGTKATTDFTDFTDYADSTQINSHREPREDVRHGFTLIDTALVELAAKRHKRDEVRGQKYHLTAHHSPLFPFFLLIFRSFPTPVLLP